MASGPYRRKRRPSDTVFTPADLRLWRQLTKAAIAQAHAPLSAYDGLVKAGDRAAKALIPLGYRHRGSEFLVLAAKARGWWRLSPAEREAQAPQLRQLAEACTSALDRLGESPGRPPRVDVFG